MMSVSPATPQLDEIDRLSAELKTIGDPSRTARLVELRHLAASRPASSTAPERWPPEVPDPYPAAREAPEVSPAELDAATLGGALTHHGCLIVRGLIPNAAVPTLVADIDRAFAGFDDWVARGASAAPSPDFVPFQPTDPAADISGLRRFIRSNGGVWTADAPVAMFDLMSCFADRGLRQVVAAYFGEAPWMSMNKCTLRKVSPEAHPEWHQDGAFLGAGVRSVNVWVALSPCGGQANRPGLDIVDRRLGELAPTGTDGAYFETSVGQAVVERIAGTQGIRRPVFEPGDALLFDELLLHRTGTSPGMTDERYAIETWLFAPSTYPAHHVPLAF